MILVYFLAFIRYWRKQGSLVTAFRYQTIEIPAGHLSRILLRQIRIQFRLCDLAKWIFVIKQIKMISPLFKVLAYDIRKMPCLPQTIPSVFLCIRIIFCIIFIYIFYLPHLIIYFQKRIRLSIAVKSRKNRLYDSQKKSKHCKILCLHFTRKAPVLFCMTKQIQQSYLPLFALI